MTIPTNLTTTPTRYPATWYDIPCGYDGPPLYRTAEYMAEQDAKYRHVEIVPTERRTERMTLVATVPTRASKVMISRTCEGCGNTFALPYPKSEQRYCCQKCASAHRHGGKRMPPVTKECPICEREFTVVHSKRHQKTCGAPECVTQMQSISQLTLAAKRKAGVA